MNDERKDLDRLVQVVLDSPKYRGVSEVVVRQIGQRELSAGRSLKQAIKATKNVLHQITGAYRDVGGRYTEWSHALTAAQTGGMECFRAACTRILRSHASTRERLSLLPEFYTRTFAALPPIRSVLDIACGLNPLTIPWMNLDREVRYEAYDIDTGLGTFLSRFFQIAGIRGTAHVCDVTIAPPTQRADLALILKALPTLEHLHKTAGLSLLRSLNVDAILVSFPVQSLGGREKGMRHHYATRWLASVQTEPWSVTRFDFATELVFLVEKREPE
ncbi:MAG: 16S rRNA methyltransferase [Candidatus Latescibacteria bacterium]|nr:16S rRNA methyltransferase [Candidatus Latescibacterota bacterium]